MFRLRADSAQQRPGIYDNIWSYAGKILQIPFKGEIKSFEKIPHITYG